MKKLPKSEDSFERSLIGKATTAFQKFTEVRGIPTLRYTQLGEILPAGILGGIQRLGVPFALTQISVPYLGKNGDRVEVGRRVWAAWQAAKAATTYLTAHTEQGSPLTPRDAVWGVFKDEGSLSIPYPVARQFTLPEGIARRLPSWVNNLTYRPGYEWFDLLQAAESVVVARPSAWDMLVAKKDKEPMPEARTANFQPAVVAAKIFGVYALAAYLAHYGIHNRGYGFVNFLNWFLPVDTYLNRDLTQGLAITGLTYFGWHMFGNLIGTIQERTSDGPKKLDPGTLQKFKIAFFTSWLFFPRLAGDSTGIHQYMPTGSDLILSPTAWVDRLAQGIFYLNPDLNMAHWSGFILGAILGSLLMTLGMSYLPQIFYNTLGLIQKRYREAMRVNATSDAGAQSGQEQSSEEQWPFHFYENEGDTPGFARVSGAQVLRPPEIERSRNGQTAPGFVGSLGWPLAFAGMAAWAVAPFISGNGLADFTATRTILGAMGIAGTAGRLGVPGLKQLSATISHFFDGRRLPFVLGATLVGGSMTGINDIVAFALQGYTISLVFAGETFLRGMLGPWLNRTVMQIRRAMGHKNISTAAILIWGWTLMLGIPLAGMQSRQALQRMYEISAATQAHANTDLSRSEHALDMAAYRVLVREALVNGGYGRRELVEVATVAQKEMDVLDVKFGVDRAVWEALAAKMSYAEALERVRTFDPKRYAQLIAQPVEP